MISAYNFHLPDFTFEIICLITILEFLSFIYMIFKLNILFNHIKYLKKLVPYYVLPSFILKHVNKLIFSSNKDIKFKFYKYTYI